jgi:hypothetical protein
MFAPQTSGWTDRLRRAAALLKAFALLEEAPGQPVSTVPRAAITHPAGRSGATSAGRAYRPQEARTHPHRQTLAISRTARRPGAPARPAQPCTMPTARRSFGTDRARA